MDYQGDPDLERVGSEIDVNKLCPTFSNLGFVLYKGAAHVNLTRIEMLKLLKEFSKDTVHEQASCAAIVIMAHGGTNGKIKAHDGIYLSIYKDIFPMFRNDRAKSLKGKPKLFLFQTCRGENLISQVDNAGEEADNDSTRRLAKTQFSDMITIFPTFKDYASVRKKEGSWFVDAFTKVFSKAENTNSLEIKDLLDKVNI